MINKLKKKKNYNPISLSGRFNFLALQNSQNTQIHKEDYDLNSETGFGMDLKDMGFSKF